MAVKIDELWKMVPADEQPMDLSQNCNRKSQKAMPPLIPITLLRSGLSGQKSPNNTKLSHCASSFLSVIKTVPSLHDNEEISLYNCTEKNLVSEDLIKAYPVLKEHSIINRDVEEQDRVCDVGKSSYCCGNTDSEEHESRNNESPLKEIYFKSDRLSRKRSHLGQDEESKWTAKRLDRARSVPHLNPLPLPLQRQKSLSESQIPGTSSNIQNNLLKTRDNNFMKTNNMIRQDLHEELYHRLQVQNAMETDADLSSERNNIYEPSLIYFDYSYLQLIKQISTQNMLHGLSIQQQSHEQQEEEQEVEEEAKDCPALPANGRDLADFKKRLARPLTGKHVRPGTGASPATLLTLRRKIQARQQLQP